MKSSGGEIEITHGEQRAVVVALGGGLRSYGVGGRELLDGYPAGAQPTSGRGQVLIPWPNRIEDGSYDFDGQRHRLPLTEPETRTALHGLVRSAEWTVGEHDPNRVVLEHGLEPRHGYPFSLVLGIEYSLSEAGLTVRTTATNAGADACPYGAGAHPYFVAGTATVDTLVLHVPGQTVVHANERGLPTRAGPVEGTEYDFRAPRPIGSTRLDHAFTNLERDERGVARIELSGPDHGLAVWLGEAYGYVQVFTGDPLPDVARRSLAVEPMTCPANAFRSGEGLIRLESGSSFTCSWGVHPIGAMAGRSSSPILAA